ncbi:MAG: hypothetical protein AB7O32_07050 [Vicinamibacterales bacterium]
MKSTSWRTAVVTLLLVACAVSAPATQTSSPGRSTQSLCRAPDALSLFAVAVGDLLRAQRPGMRWSVFQVPCETLPGVIDAPAPLVLIVDPGFAGEQEVLSYGFVPFPFATSARVVRQPDDPFARLGRFVLPPRITTVPSIWVKGTLAPEDVDALRLAAAAGAVQAVTAFRDGICESRGSEVPGLLLEAAERHSRHRPDYHAFFDAALEEFRHMRGTPSSSLTTTAEGVVNALRPVTVPGLKCDVGNRDRFSLMPFGPGVTSLARAGVHIDAAVSGARRGQRDLAQLNLARVCAFQAISEMVRARREPSCRADDYGLWTGAYAPLLHAAEVKVLETSR